MSGMIIEEAPGLCMGPTRGQTYSTMDRYRNEADIGSVWFTDRKLVDATIGRGLTGRIENVNDWTWVGDLVWTNGYVRFAATGACVTVTGNLCLSNGNSRLDIGGCEYRCRSAFIEIWGGAEQNRLTVGGDLKVLSGARLDIRAAEKRETYDWGGEVQVGGVFQIGVQASTYAWSDIFTCSSPRFRVGSLVIDEGGLLSAERRGGAGAYNNTSYRNAIGESTIYGYGPLGHDQYLAPLYTLAGQHIGLGARGTGQQSGWSNPRLYDDAYRPCQTGTGGGSAGYGDGGSGGGLIYLVATGEMRVDGEINVDGTHTYNGSASHRYQEGGGSAGTIFLSGASFSGGEHAVLSAVGGAGVQESATTAGAAGAGGCIAVWTGVPWTPDIKEKRVGRSEIIPSSFKGRTKVSGGGMVYDSTASSEGWEQPERSIASDGTVRFCHVDNPPGLILLFR